jgi:transcriptional regulator with XRE-family HTH domain
MEKWYVRATRRRKEIGITLDWLAEQFGRTTGSIQKWLAGTRDPDVENIIRIAELIRCSPAWLLLGMDDDDQISGLNPEAQASLRRLIQAERAAPLPASFWSAIDAMAQTVAPAHPTAGGAETPSDHPAPRNGTDG